MFTVIGQFDSCKLVMYPWTSSIPYIPYMSLRLGKHPYFLPFALDFSSGHQCYSMSCHLMKICYFHVAKLYSNVTQGRVF